MVIGRFRTGRGLLENGIANSGLAEEGLDFLEEGRACKGCDEGGVEGAWANVAGCVWLSVNLITGTKARSQPPPPPCPRYC